ncbi:hypothetical protein AB7M17_003036 [Bradyrhizobium sp. USDA 377]
MYRQTGMGPEDLISALISLSSGWSFTAYFLEMN